jgi:hypothetical protein
LYLQAASRAAFDAAAFYFFSGAKATGETVATAKAAARTALISLLMGSPPGY